MKLTTAHLLGISGAVMWVMPSDLLTLVHRDHDDLQLELTQLLDPEATTKELRASLDGVRLGLTAHAEAEDIVLEPFAAIPQLVLVIQQARAAHLAQESALAALVCSAPRTTTWRERAATLRELVASHAAREERNLFPLLRALSRYGELAGKFATARLRQLAMLQPSAPIMIPQLVV